MVAEIHCHLTLMVCPVLTENTDGETTVLIPGLDLQTPYMDLHGHTTTISRGIHLTCISFVAFTHSERVPQLTAITEVYMQQSLVLKVTHLDTEIWPTK